MPKINENELAREVTLREGKNQSISIAQVKEVLRCLEDVFSDSFGINTYAASDILRWLGR